MDSLEFKDCVERLKSNVQTLEALGEVADEIERLRANLTEALRLMEPVADLVGGAVNGNWTYLVPYDDARAIAYFVKRMKGTARVQQIDASVVHHDGPVTVTDIEISGLKGQMHVYGGVSQAVFEADSFTHKDSSGRVINRLGAEDAE